ncbi:MULTISPECIES: hypothetical protein [unclassified Pseudoxanthomonas]|uniref:hypothetical protein n=1 Tax=unclassified Pseudoxanthomonas TaxID=2645906 RepID=UPI001618BAB6|nr:MULTISPECIES: hypothetical protein [unclassified Pseudoxanthomonas]MBB3275781.1 hypothetical protein [Pseudoxanthomonas sp. OG2]MBV7473134.1 hypothetical protein [Pseudoxanthomonas sp. PXM05]
MKRTLIVPAMLASVLALSACGDREAEQRAAAQAQAAANEEAATQLAGKFDAAQASRDWEMARIHGVALLDQYPDTQAATRIKPLLEEVKAKAEGAREERRLQALWDYAQIATDGGTQRTAAIHSKDPVDVDGSGAKPVQLIFRDHPKWKRSSYLVLQASDFRCPGGCKVKVTADGAPARAMDAWRPDTDEAIAMFITDQNALWKLAGKTRMLEIEFPVKAGGTRKAVFETSGLDGSQMPGWE